MPRAHPLSLLLPPLLALVAHAAKAKGGGGGGGKNNDNANQCSADFHNCFASRRCCNTASACYTKAAGLRFAQCRPGGGCIGTCGWECKLLRPHSTLNGNGDGPPVYGKGSQRNVTEAVEAMKAPFAPPADGSRPPGNSDRLGNIIDSWYFASLGVGPRLLSLTAMTCGIQPSFAKFLGTRLGQVSASASQAKAAFEELGRHESWGLYAYPTIRALMPQLRHDLRVAMREYGNTYDPLLNKQEYSGGPRHLVVHYRLGDFVTNSWCIPPEDLAAAAADLSPTVIELMDGGKKHLEQVDGYGAHRANRSRLNQAMRMAVDVQTELEAALRTAVPRATIVRHVPVSIDADWFRLAHAPMLITAAGSFAVTAAIAGHGKHVRTPAADNLNFPDRKTREEEVMAPNWRTYRYDRARMRG